MAKTMRHTVNDDARGLKRQRNQRERRANNRGWLNEDEDRLVWVPRGQR